MFNKNMLKSSRCISFFQPYNFFSSGNSFILITSSFDIFTPFFSSLAINFLSSLPKAIPLTFSVLFALSLAFRFAVLALEPLRLPGFFLVPPFFRAYEAFLALPAAFFLLYRFCCFLVVLCFVPWEVFLSFAC